MKQLGNIIKETIKLRKANGTAVHNVPDKNLIDSFENTKSAADSLCEVTQQLLEQISQHYKIDR